MKSGPTVFTHLRRFEGYRPSTYQDPKGVWTGGYGHTGPDVKPNRPVSKAQAEAWLAADVRAAEAAVEALVERATQQQYDALVCFVFNVGRGAFARSQLRKRHNEAAYAEAEGEFGRWVYAGHDVLPGLVKRRQAEAAIYHAGCPTG